jgi:hypothetical protein
MTTHPTTSAGLGLAALVLTLGGFSEVSAQTSLTIYGDGRVLQRRTIELRLTPGNSTHQLQLGQIDAASIFALDSGVAVTGVVYDPAVDLDNALRRSVGRELSFETRGVNGVRETVTAVVLGVDPERYRLATGQVTFERPGSPLFPAELVPAAASLTVGLRSDRARSSVGLGMFSGGAAWSASYAITLGRSIALIAGHATLVSKTLRIDSAQVQLLAGNVGRASPSSIRSKDMFVRAAPTAMAEQAAEEQVGEAHLYTLPGRHSLVPGIETSAMLFDPVAAPSERAYTVRGQLPYWGGLPQQGEEQTEPVHLTFTLKRTARTAFGDLPLPGGVARIYERDAAGRPQLVGEANLSHTAAGQDLKLDAGTAFDLTARRVQTAYETQREGRRTIAFASYTVTLANAKDSAVTVDVLEQRGGEWSLVTSSIPGEKISSTTTRFRVRVPAKGDATLTYRVRVVW